MAAKAIGESALQLLTNALADYGSLGAEAVSSPLLFARGFGNEEDAEEFARLREERRAKLPTFTPSEQTQAAQAEFFDPIKEWTGEKVQAFSEENPNASEAIGDYFSDPRVMHTLGALELGLPSGARAAKAFKNKAPTDVPDMNKQTGNVDFFGGASQRTLKEGIYKDPKTLAQEAEAMVAPESGAMQELFGVTRADLSDIARNRQGNMPGEFWQAANPKGSVAAKNIMTPQNEDRLREALIAAEQHAPRLVEGMDGWYVLDPWKDKFVERLGDARGLEKYSKWNAMTAMNSPGAPVDWEIPRGSSAYMLDEQGRIDDWFRHAGAPGNQRGQGFPQELMNVPGHPYHSTAHSKPIRDYLAAGGQHVSKAPKVPLYRQASEAPEIGFQTDTPVPDAHWSRAVGLGDVRTNKTPGASATGTEMTDLAPWWRDEIAGEVGLESVPGQARAWGLFAPQTGVETPVGAPKLELISDAIMDTSRRMNISPQEAMDRIIEGTAYAGR